MATKAVPLREAPLDRPLAAEMAEPPGETVRLFWLGQAGFVIEGDGRRVVIDPYLSDSLAEKYRGKRFPHLRMMVPPVEPGAIAHVDAVLATHAHSDHLDPGTLPALLSANPRAMLVAPRSARDAALQRAGTGAKRLVGIDAGETLELDGLRMEAVRAAHEALERDDQGFYRFLGLALTVGRTKIFHSGDTVPFDGQAEEVRALEADCALLPVNGRDAERRANGVPGNMNMTEALALCREAAIGSMIAHHFDMFSFNTTPRAQVEDLASRSRLPHAMAARAGRVYVLEAGGAGGAER